MEGLFQSARDAWIRRPGINRNRFQHLAARARKVSPMIRCEDWVKSSLDSNSAPHGVNELQRTSDDLDPAQVPDSIAIFAPTISDRALASSATENRYRQSNRYDCPMPINTIDELLSLAPDWL